MEEKKVFPMKEKFMNPFTDAGFKRIFGSEINKEMIIRFLNSLLSENIVNITFRNVEALGMGRNHNEAASVELCREPGIRCVYLKLYNGSQLSGEIPLGHCPYGSGTKDTIQ